VIWRFFEVNLSIIVMSKIRGHPINKLQNSTVLICVNFQNTKKIGDAFCREFIPSTSCEFDYDATL